MNVIGSLTGLKVGDYPIFSSILCAILTKKGYQPICRICLHHSSSSVDAKNMVCAETSMSLKPVNWKINSSPMTSS